jgi:hypothetical protein
MYGAHCTAAAAAGVGVMACCGILAAAVTLPVASFQDTTCAPCRYTSAVAPYMSSSTLLGPGLTHAQATAVQQCASGSKCKLDASAQPARS